MLCLRRAIPETESSLQIGWYFTRRKICTIESGDSTHMPFIFVLPDLGIKDGVYREFVKAEFYDMDRNLVETVVGNGQKTEE